MVDLLPCTSESQIKLQRNPESRKLRHALGEAESFAHDEGDQTTIEDPDLLAGVIVAPPRLAMEMANLICFKTATLTALGFQRNGV